MVTVSVGGLLLVVGALILFTTKSILLRFWLTRLLLLVERFSRDTLWPGRYVRRLSNSTGGTTRLLPASRPLANVRAWACHGWGHGPKPSCTPAHEFEVITAPMRD